MWEKYTWTNHNLLGSQREILKNATQEKKKMQLRSWECGLFVIELVKEAVLVIVLVEQTTSRQESKPGDLRLSCPMLVGCLNSTWNTEST